MLPLNYMLPTGTELLILSLILLPILFIFFVLPIIICVKRAGQLNRSKPVWGLLGFALNYIAVLVLYILPKEQNKE